MTVLRSVSWDDSKKKRRRLALAVTALFLVLPSAPAHRGGPPPPFVTVIVESLPGAAAQVRDAVAATGGAVTRDLGVIGAVVARVPVAGVAELRTGAGVRSVVLDGRVRLHSTPAPASTGPYDPTADNGSMWRLTRVIGARSLWAEGVTGHGVDVALIDSGVVPVTGLDPAGKIVNGPDLSYESQSRELRYLDTFGHGTHMAGIIAGNDGGSDSSGTAFLGVAPDARILSIKVADATGAADVSQVLAAIDWVVQHRDDHGLHIRVLNLSFGTDSAQRDNLDPLIHAVDVAWRAGIVVVAAGGNRGEQSGQLDDPARSAHVIAVGADDPNGTASTSDDTVPEWSSSGASERVPDVVAPGKSVVSLRDPGSYIDQQHPGGRVGDLYFRGSGTSTSTAVVSGVVALLLQRYPGLAPDEVKAMLIGSAHRVPRERSSRQGAGLVNARDAAHAVGVAVPIGDQTVDGGSGSLEAARGSSHVAVDGRPLVGEQDIFGAAWDGARWARASSDGVSWTGGIWNGNRWTGDDWSGTSWAGAAWATADWTGSSSSSSGGSWSGNSWSGNTWSGNSWSGNSWSGNSWSGNSWSFLEGGR